MGWVGVSMEIDAPPTALREVTRSGHTDPRLLRMQQGPPPRPSASPCDPPTLWVPTWPQGTLEFVIPDFDGLGAVHPN